METLCKRDGCERPAAVKGWCRSHYINEWQKAKRALRDRTVVCAHCCTSFTPLRYRDGRNKFCSRKCKDAAHVASGASAQASLRAYYKRRYGLTTEEVANLRQEGCGICGRLDGNGRHNQLHIDHDHRTGRVRGVLCHGCNVAIGHLREDPRLLEAAMQYLNRTRVLDYTP